MFSCGLIVRSMGSIFAEKALYGSDEGTTNPTKSGRVLGSAFRGMRTASWDFIFGTVRSSAVHDRSRNKRPPQSPSSSLERESGPEAPFPPQAIPSHCMNSAAAYECGGPSVSPQCPFMARDVGLWLDPNDRCPPFADIRTDPLPSCLHTRSWRKLALWVSYQ